MDQLIEMLVQFLIDLFRNSGQKPAQQPPPRPMTKQPIPQRRPQPAFPQRQQMARHQAKQLVRVPSQAPAPAVVQQAKPKQNLAPTAAPPASVKKSSVPVDAAALRRWLRPNVLHDQFILSEIFQPPLALRDQKL